MLYVMCIMYGNVRLRILPWVWARFQLKSLYSGKHNVSVFTFYVWRYWKNIHETWFLLNDQRDAQILFCLFISIYNSLHVSSTQCSSSGETNCINTASGNSHSMLVAEMCAGWKKTLLQTCTHLDCCQRLYWYNLSLLMMSTVCSKHVESCK